MLWLKCRLSAPQVASLWRNDLAIDTDVAIRNAAILFAASLPDTLTAHSKI